MLKEAVGASISYCGRGDGSFVLSYLFEIIVHRRRPLESDSQPKYPYGPWGPPMEERVGGNWLHLPFPVYLDLWMNVKANSDWMALIPTEPGKLSVVTTGGAVEVPDEPYWLFVRFRSHAPILAANGIAVSGESHDDSRDVLLLKFSRRDICATSVETVHTFFKKRREKFGVKEDPPERLDKLGFDMQKHLANFYRELVKVYGDIAPNAGGDEVHTEFIDDLGMLSVVGRN